MQEDNISQLGDYDAQFFEQQYTHGSCYISLFKFKSSDQFNIPQTASNFRHLLSCDTIVIILSSGAWALLEVISVRAINWISQYTSRSKAIKWVSVLISVA